MTDYIRDVGGPSVIQAKEQPFQIKSTNTPPIGGNTRELSFSGTGTLQPVIGSLPYPAGGQSTILSARAAVGTPSGGAAIQVGIKKNGVSILAAPLTIAAGQQYSGKIVPATTGLNEGDRITIDILQVGTTTPGSNLVLILEVTST